MSNLQWDRSHGEIEPTKVTTLTFPIHEPTDEERQLAWLEGQSVWAVLTSQNPAVANRWKEDTVGYYMDRWGENPTERKLMLMHALQTLREGLLQVNEETHLPSTAVELDAATVLVLTDFLVRSLP
jgi:3-methyladenine DNA glycosylase AlkD